MAHSDHGTILHLLGLQNIHHHPQRVFISGAILIRCGETILWTSGIYTLESHNLFLPTQVNNKSGFAGFSDSQNLPSRLVGTIGGTLRHHSGMLLPTIMYH